MPILTNMSLNSCTNLRIHPNNNSSPFRILCWTRTLKISNRRRKGSTKWLRVNSWKSAPTDRLCSTSSTTTCRGTLHLQDIWLWHLERRCWVVRRSSWKNPKSVGSNIYLIGKSSRPSVYGPAARTEGSGRRSRSISQKPWEKRYQTRNTWWTSSTPSSRIVL